MYTTNYCFTPLPCYKLGCRSRASWKLVQLDSKFSFLKSAHAVLDLCAAPGGWMQVAVQRAPVGSLVLGLDLVPIAPIRGAVALQQDITKSECKSKVKRVMEERGVMAYDSDDEMEVDDRGVMAYDSDDEMEVDDREEKPVIPEKSKVKKKQDEKTSIPDKAKEKKVNNAAAPKSTKLQASKPEDDFEIVPAPATGSSDDSSSDDSEDDDVETKAEILAYEEKRHRQPIKPVTKEEIAAMRAQFKEINARPAKKVAEAKARKKRIAMKKLEKVRQKANNISDQADISERSKRKQIEQLYKKATPKKPQKEYVVAKKGVQVRTGKGKVLVDRRMKKDARARGPGKPGKGGSKKGKNGKSKKGKGSVKASGMKGNKNKGGRMHD
ncbi:hypothetical protein GQ457_04G002090 [Hibiscus cannabinus]